MFEDFKTEKEKKYFFLIIGLILLLLFVLRYFILPLIYEHKVTFNYSTVYSILENLFISFLVTIAIGLFLFWLAPKNKHNADIKILQPIEIGETIVKARTNTEKWYFNGGSGRYTRTQTLPFLASLSRQKNKSIDINIIIMNPKNESLCLKYAEYRNSLRTAEKKGKKDLRSVRLDLLATIVSCHIWKSEQPSLNIRLGLKDNFSLFRTDLSSIAAIITKEDPNEPAIFYKKDSFFYTAHQEDIKQTLKQVEIIELQPFFTKDTVNKDNVRQLITNLNFINLIDDADMEKLLRMSLDTTNPYA